MCVNPLFAPFFDEMDASAASEVCDGADAGIKHSEVVEAGLKRPGMISDPATIGCCYNDIGLICTC